MALSSWRRASGSLKYCCSCSSSASSLKLCSGFSRNWSMIWRTSSTLCMTWRRKISFSSWTSADFVQVTDQASQVADGRVGQYLVRPLDHRHLDWTRKRQNVLDPRLGAGHQAVDGLDQGTVLRAFLAALLERQ